MKQKRKVKSLFPQKKDYASLVTTLLLILSLLLCIGTAALVTSFALASNNNDIETYNFKYEGIDNQREVVYGIKFADPSNMRKITNNIFVQSGTLYISPNPVVVNPPTSDGSGIDRTSNVVENGINSYILGGKNNKVKSQNINLMAGEGIEVESGNNNASILGGDGNKFHQYINSPSLRDKYYRFPLVSIGGKNNSGIKALFGAVFIGGSGNEIGAGNEINGLGSNLFIIGGENNKITNSQSFPNVIIGGKNIKISQKKNVFAYSNSNDDFTPQSRNAFYLNMEKGVGVNTTGGSEALFVNGGVYIGEVDIVHSPCNSVNNYGIVGSYQGCLVGCTKVSSESSSWEMLDLGNKCKEICEDSTKCVSPTDTASADEEENKIYIDAQCTNNVDTGNAKICSRDKNFESGYLEFYKNVIFETTLLDSDQPCPEGQENQCVYKCNPDYHLIGNTNGTYRCHKDCELPWNKTIKKKHGDTIEAYNVTGVSCSNDIYVFPLNTQIINAGFPALSPTGLSRGTVQVYNVLYPNRATNGRSPETCDNYDHKKTLICQEGNWYIMKENGQPITSDEGKRWVEDYQYESCSLKSYKCDTGIYNLTLHDIYSIDYISKMGDMYDNYNNTDRGITNGTRGIYKLCKDYTANQGNKSCTSTNNDPNTHFQLVGCQAHYSIGNKPGEDDWKYICKQDCTLKNENGDTVYYRHNDEAVGYKSGSVVCTATDKCESVSMICRDGQWYNSVSYPQGNPVTDYNYNVCKLSNQECTGYGVSEAIYNQYKDTSEYISCDLYNADTNRNVCILNGTKYKLVGCNPGYHANSSKTHCIPNAEVRNCTNKWTGSHGEWDRRPGGIVQHYPGYLNLRQEDRDLQVNSGQYIAVWTGTWDNGYWTGMYPENACDWSCKSGYRKSGNRCVDTQCSRGDKPTGSESDGVIKGNTHPSGNSDLEWSYTTGKNLGDCQWSCKEDYHRIPNRNTCESNTKTVSCTTGGTIPANSDYVLVELTVTWDSTGNKWGDIDPCDWKCNEPDYILNEAHTGCILKPSCPAGKYLDEENHCEFTPPGTYSPDGDINKYNCPAGKHSNAAATSAEECWSYADLDVYIVGPDSGVKSYSLMDRNLGATEIYNGDIDHPNVASYGYHYQWGNNYGFLPCTTNGCTEFPNGESSSASPVSDPDPKYIPSKYINNVYITADNYLVNRINNEGQGYNRIKDFWGNITNTSLSEKGPCPNGYHVPSKSDFNDLNSSWRLANNLGRDNSELINLDNEVINKLINEGSVKFMKDFIVPPAGRRNSNNTAAVQNLGKEYFLWSRSVESTNSSPYIIFLNSISVSKNRYNGGTASVRCIKNTKNDRTTIDPNGGTGAVISIVGGKIHSLGTPSKEGKVFQGWYADPSFTQKVQTGSQATQYLYAKWTDEASEDIETYLITGSDINQAMRDVTEGINRDNIKYFKRSTTDNHEEAENGFDEIQIPDNGYPEVYLWYDPDDKTIYYYTDATTIYMNKDASRMFEYFGDPGYYEYGALETIDLSDLNMSKVTNMSRMFYNCRNLKSIKLGPDFDTSIVTDMSHMFSSCSSLTNTGLDLSKFDTRNVVDMSSMFAGCSSIKHLNLSLYENFRTNNVTNMESMFAGGPELTCNSLSKFNTSKVENMSMMFQGTQSKSLDLTSFDTNKVTNMSSMFANSNLTTVDLTSFDTSIVVNMDDMFSNSPNLTTIYASESFKVDSLHSEYNCPDYGRNCSSVGDQMYWANDMFAGCVNLSTPYTSFSCEYDGDDWNVDLCQGAFIAYIGSDDERDGLFTAKDDSLGDFCNGAEDNAARLVEGYEINRKMVDLARGEGNIKKFDDYSMDLDENPLPSGTRTETISVQGSRRDVIIWYDEGDETIYYYTKADKIYMNPDSSRMFEGLYNLSSINISADDHSRVKWDTSKVKNMSRMFKDCDSLVDKYSILPLETWDTSSVEDMSSMFAGCYNLQELSPLSSWDTSSVEDMSSMFSHCDENKNCTYEDSVNISPLSNWNTSSVKNMSSMFEGFWFHYDGIDPLSGWDTSSVEDMSYMFYDINEFYDVDALSNWDTSSVKDMSHMFESCFELGSIHLEWNTSNVENMNSMFRGCDFGEVVTKKTLDNGDDVLLSGWDTSKVKDMSNMFSLNNSIEYVELNGWDTSSVENMSSMFSNCISLKDIIINEWDTSSVKDMSSMFNMCTDLETLNLNSRDTSNVTNMSHMFMECNDENGNGCSKKLKKIYASEYFVTDNVSDSENMFYGTPYLKGGYGTEYDVSHRNKEYARIDKEGQKGYFTYKTPTPIDGVCGTRPYTCESGKLDFSNYDGPVLNRYYTVGETPYISGYQWDCNGKFNGENAIGCVTCDDDDYYRKINKGVCEYKPRIYTCALRYPIGYAHATQVCKLKNEGDNLICVNEENPDCTDDNAFDQCCFWSIHADYLKDDNDRGSNESERIESCVGCHVVKYSSLYDYQAYIYTSNSASDSQTEILPPPNHSLGTWKYKGVLVEGVPREHGYREEGRE